MATVFLSYARDDADHARLFAKALEVAGHSVWWDLDVRGGAQFSKAIEEALEAADVVVVLWSTNSVESAWVRDEASVGTLDAWSRLDLRYGNLAEAAGAPKLMQSGKVSAGRIGEAFVRARLDPTKANVDHAVELATVRGRMLTEWQNSSARLASSVERTSD